MEDVADAMGMSYASLHARLINRTSFSADEIKKIIVQVPDIRLIEYFLETTDFIPVHRQVARYEGGVIHSLPPADVVSVQREASRIVIDATDVLEFVDAGVAGGQIDHRVARLALQAIKATERALASLRFTLRAFDR
ncbi:hypothetical protein [Methylobacterium sp. E-046]|uniref:hypothetical protein n=1 Tax=Methylobacterium sp. E-046 TaxID=2836576 RepID=UPI001FBAF950|nr:hypothetical protein [Methylobacterium sp. E-046]MCJ2103074.1 hypothetical protein [Methylobacterium sp. E-046]